jgi:hypothetical protein
MSDRPINPNSSGSIKLAITQRTTALLPIDCEPSARLSGKINFNDYIITVVVTPAV